MKALLAGAKPFGWRFWVWTVAFLGMTVLSIAAEVTASFDRSDNTQPWTWYISHYVPWPIALGAYVALAAWLPFHFWYHYRHTTMTIEAGSDGTVVVDGRRNDVHRLAGHPGVRVDYAGEHVYDEGRMVELTNFTVKGDADKVQMFLDWLVRNDDH